MCSIENEESFGSKSVSLLSELESELIEASTLVSVLIIPRENVYG
jgi:hypothetical protein